MAETIREQLERWVVEEQLPDGHYQKVPLMEIVERHVAERMADGLDMDRLAQSVVEPYDTDPTMGRCRVCGEDGSRVGYIDQPDAIATAYRGSR